VRARRKAAYLALESDAEYEFEFFLARELNMSVARLRREMPNDEFLTWSVYFGRLAQERELAEKSQAARR